jgi:3-methyladenine DNA glycosylase AlkD
LTVFHATVVFMAPRVNPLPGLIRADLAKAAQPARAAGMRAYLKSEMPCHGLTAAVLRRIVKERAGEHPVRTIAEWQRVTLTLWREAEFREERHAAIEFIRLPSFRSYRVIEALSTFEEMIVTGAWWDLVDPLATHVLGDVLEDQPRRTAALMRRWSRDPDMWKRRSSILCQVGFKARTDLRLLYDCIEPNLADREFFIRKAIGWALRAHAWTDQSEIKRYVKANRTRLSGLSAREALKNV